MKPSREQKPPKRISQSTARKLLEALELDAEQVYAILCSDLGGDIPARIIAAQEHVQKWREVLRKARG